MFASHTVLWKIGVWSHIEQRQSYSMNSIQRPNTRIEWHMLWLTVCLLTSTLPVVDQNRIGPPMVWESRHDGLVERIMAERGICNMGWLAGHRPLVSRVRGLVSVRDRSGTNGTTTRLAESIPSNRGAGERRYGNRPDLRLDKLLEGEFGYPHVKLSLGSRGIPSRCIRLSQGPRLW